ncbi:MAG: UDP-N-acetylglucosamine--N-acetylmuramyl-(pentapeptide) pyrophosphoryl-undecaprenol N-acetylglucosamine transferase [Dehalococcoidia bacterium]
MLTGGGTGGHVYPALSVAEALPRRACGESIELLFAGTARGDVRRLATDAGIPYVEVRAAPLRGRSPGALLRSMWTLAAGVWQSWRGIGRFRPAAVLATGGYASVPVSLAAWLRRVPLVLYLPDVYPGWAARLIARLATRVTTTTDGALHYLPRRKAVVTGYPVRAAFFVAERNASRMAAGAGPDVPLLLVTGATQGAHTINEAVFRALPSLLGSCAVLHQTGAADFAAAQSVCAGLAEVFRERYRPVAYLDDMPQAMAAADLVVMRSGASALAEPPAAGAPAVLVPGAFSDQRHNALFMQERGAALLLEEPRLRDLAGVVLGLLNDRPRLRRMAANAAALARPDAADAIADVLLGVAA